MNFYKISRYLLSILGSHIRYPNYSCEGGTLFADRVDDLDS